MAILDDELQADRLYDEQCVRYIREALPETVCARYTDEILQALLDATVACLCDSEALDAEADDDDFVDLNIDVIAEDVLATVDLPADAPALSHDDVCLVIERFMDFEEENADE
jgi:hypothetical protein